MARPRSRTWRPGSPWEPDRPPARRPSSVNADVLHAPHYTMPLRPGRAVVSTIHELTYFTEPDAHNPGHGDLLQVRDPHCRPGGPPGCSCRPRPPGTNWSACSAPTRPGSTWHITAWTTPCSTGPPWSGCARYPNRLACTASRMCVPRRPGAAQERPRTDQRLGRGRGRLADPPALVLGGGSGLERGGWTRPSPLFRRTCALVRPGIPPLHRPAWFPGRRARGGPSRAGAEGFGLPGWRPWPAARRCLPRTGRHSRRSAGTRSPTPNRTPRISGGPARPAR